MTDSDYLAGLEAKLEVIRTRTRGVVRGYATGYYLWGEGGTSKSYTVLETLDAEKVPYKVTNTRITGKGLFELLDGFPDAVHVLDDVETLFGDKHAHGVLRAALWGQEGEPRSIVWQTGPGGRRETVFTGGVVMIANCPLEDVPTLRAMRTRISSTNFRPSNEEIAALMRRIAAKGFRKLSSEQCLEVAGEILARTVRLNRNLDLRLLINTFKDRIQCEDGYSSVHWIDLLDSRLQEKVIKPTRPVSNRREAEVALAQEIAGLPGDAALAKWQAETGKSRASMYRRLSEISNPN